MRLLGADCDYVVKASMLTLRFGGGRWASVLR
jgi:hypothetical protein